jgi:hypothetical protein
MEDTLFVQWCNCDSSSGSIEKCDYGCEYNLTGKAVCSNRPSSCTQPICGGENVAGCLCGDAITTEGSLYCCGQSSGVFSNQSDCQAACQSSENCTRGNPCNTSFPCCSDLICSSQTSAIGKCYDPDLSLPIGSTCYGNPECDGTSWKCVDGKCTAKETGIEDEGEDDEGAGSGGSGNTAAGGGGIDNPIDADSFQDLINAVINFIFWVVVALAPLMIIIAGFNFMMAGGDPNKITTAKNIILWTAVGLFIVLFAKGLIAVLSKVLGVE